MNIDAISLISNDEITKTVPVVQVQENIQTSFMDYVSNIYTDMNEKVNAADNKLKEYAVGETTNIHDVLLSIEKAKGSFELGLQVRNRLLEGYQEIMRMQV